MIKLINVSYNAEDKKQILKDINLSIDDSKLVVITGPNGGGKSTLAKIITGILQPTSGQIFFNDIDITNMTITERAKLGISFAFQQPVRFKGITVKDLITLAARKEICDEEINHYLSEVGLEGDKYINREVNSSLSGGEMKRIELATVMAKETSLYVFDEPEAGIDIWSFKSLIEVFNKLKSKEKSMIIISHQERIMDVADEIVILKDGEIVSHASVEDTLPCLLDNRKRPCCKKRGVE